MVGVLVEIGRGALAPGDIAALLAGPSAAPARLTAPASGLFLEWVGYTGGTPLPALHAATPVPNVESVEKLENVKNVERVKIDSASRPSRSSR